MKAYKKILASITLLGLFALPIVTVMPYGNHGKIFMDPMAYASDSILGGATPGFGGVEQQVQQQIQQQAAAEPPIMPSSADMGAMSATSASMSASAAGASGYAAGAQASSDQSVKAATAAGDGTENVNYQDTMQSIYSSFDMTKQSLEETVNREESTPTRKEGYHRGQAMDLEDGD